MAVTREEVIFAYRLLLDRLPESETVIEIHTHAENLRKLLHGFLRSPEFLNKTHGLAVEHLPLNVPPMDIDTDADDADASRCIEIIKAAWTQLGATQPYFSILTEPRFLPEHIDGSVGDFWHTGHADATLLENILLRHGSGALATKTCVDYGCGVGRVTFGLAHKCAVVHAYDISTTHLTHAARRAREIPATNIVFHLCADDPLEELYPCDLFYSTIVFQHNPPVVISRLIRNALKSLKPSGFAFFQVPTYELGYSFKTAEWIAAEHVSDMQMHCLPQAAIFKIVAEEHCAVLEVREDDWAGPRSKRVSNSFVIRKSN